MTEPARRNLRLVPSTTPVEPGLLAMARKARELRKHLTAAFPHDIFVDKAWDMMIELVIAHASCETLWVKDLILLSGERPTSALRRIDRLQETGLIVRHTDPRDHRRVRVELTARGVASMTAMLRHLYGGDDGTPAGPPVSFAPKGLG
jgi:DNA-binding MarR family transcriptional regulator